MTTETITEDSTANTTENSAANTAGDTARVVPPVRLAVDKLVPHVSKAMNALEAATRKVSLEAPLLELVRTRAAQINGCAYCVDMHTQDARKGGETEQRLYALPVWRETPFFTARERAAIELTEAMTRVADSEVGDEVFNRASAQFTEVELAELMWVIAVINLWTRLGATARPWPLV